MNWLTVLIVNARLVLIPTIAYMRDPTMVLYRIPSIFFAHSQIPHPNNNFEFAFFHVETLEDLLDLASLVHGDGTVFSIPLKFHF